MFKMHKIETFKMHNVGTASTFKTPYMVLCVCLCVCGQPIFSSQNDHFQLVVPPNQLINKFNN